MSTSAISHEHALVAGLRMERDRFVALAFCWAEVLIELDERADVVFAAGALPALAGLDADAAVGKPVRDLVAAEDHVLLDRLLELAERQGRIENVSIRLRGADGITKRLSVAGYRLAELHGHYFLALRRAAAVSPDRGDRPLTKDGETGLHDADSLKSVITDAIVAGRSQGQLLTLLAAEGYEALQERIGRSGEQEMLASIGTLLKASSAGGDAAGRIGADRFGVLHEPGVDVVTLQDGLAAVMRQADPSGIGAAIHAATVDLDQTGLADQDLAKALVFMMNRFRNLRGAAFTLNSLAAGITDMAREVVSTVATFRRAIMDGAFDVVFQPILDARSGAVHHYEALVRFPDTGHGTSPYERIVFAEEAGLIAEFDLAMARRVIQWLSGTPINSATRVAVNISGASVESLSYLSELDKLLSQNLWAKGRLLFEITESVRMERLDPANTFIQHLRSNGHKVCLDDFGAGAANFQYLARLEVDIVKLDGQALRDARHGQKGLAFFKALVALCRELGVATIAEMVEDDGMLQFVRRCGVQFVQGNLFGAPHREIGVFRDQITSHMFR
ncbi:MAG: EAL domain-containing protein [Rhodospirillales bacterium]|nr:MAG: EAL domain-containing protein [Rhodospirillales bacterium]